ncbi:MAG TPA: glycosyltransferase family 39 protein, partial [Candidatus Krumholzibacterium sp.]|nr:glycosyltransferase family 39 protein [Candidatus Krumholzibacterium sp.]
MPERTQAALAGLVVLLILVFHLTVAWQDMATLSCNGFLYDDSFYAFKIARNIAAGNGLTFDGVHPTTGFQPLYVFLLVPAYMAAGSDLVTPVYIALTMLALLTSLTAWLVYRISRRYTGFVPAVLAAAVWGFSPIVTKQGANGLETGLSTFMIALSVYYYIDRVRPHWKLPNGRFAVLGMLLGVTVLSRIDGVFLVLAMMLDYLLVLRKRKMAAQALVRVSLMSAGVALLYGPWLLVNMLQSGSPIQDSGSATRFLSMAYATYFDNGGSNIADRGPDAAFILEHLKHSLSTIKITPPTHVLFRSLDKVGELAGFREPLHFAGNIAGIMALIAMALSIRKWKKDPEFSRRRELDFLLLLGGLLILSYSTYIFGAFFFMR